MKGKTETTLRAWVGAIHEHQERAEELRGALEALGPVAVKQAMSKQRCSLRGLAKRIDRSPTYLSRIATGAEIVSQETYVRLVEQTYVPALSLARRRSKSIGPKLAITTGGLP